MFASNRVLRDPVDREIEREREGGCVIERRELIFELTVLCVACVSKGKERERE